MNTGIARRDEEMESAWFSELSGPPVILDRQAELEAIRRAKGGDEMAQEKLIRSQLRWLIKLAGEVERPAMIGTDELVSVGALELLRALGSYDEHRGVRLTSFCERSIKRAMWRYVCDNDGAIKVPGGAANRNNVRARLSARNFGETHRAFTAHSVLKESGVTLGDYLAVTVPASKETWKRPEKARQAFITLYAAAGLTRAEQKAFNLVFLEASKERRVEDVAREMGVCKQTVRNYVASAWRKMQAHVGAEPSPVPYNTHQIKTGKARARHEWN